MTLDLLNWAPTKYTSCRSAPIIKTPVTKKSGVTVENRQGGLRWPVSVK